MASRTLIDIRRGADLLDASGVEDRDPVRHRQRFFLVVRDEDERDPDLALQLLELDLHLLAQLEVERTQRLVEQQDAGAVDQGTSQGNTLALTTGHLGRLALLEAGELHAGQRLQSAR